MARYIFRLTGVIAMVLVAGVVSSPTAAPIQATCVLEASTGSSVAGTLTAVESPSGGAVRITGTISGLTPGHHGFHVHRDGSTANDCKAAGPHFNPSNSPHGAPGDHESRRHAGDLGNIEASPEGVANIDVTTDQIHILPNLPTTATGRAIVVHAKADDLGKGRDEESTKTGNAGSRLACCVLINDL